MSADMLAVTPSFPTRSSCWSLEFDTGVRVRKEGRTAMSVGRSLLPFPPNLTPTPKHKHHEFRSVDPFGLFWKSVDDRTQADAPISTA